MGPCFYRGVCWIGLLGCLSALPANAAASNPTTTIAQLPNVQINAAKVDSSGNIYVAGQSTTSAAYIARLSPNGATLYTVHLGGSGSSRSAATALDIDSAGNVYVAGTTTASDFPVSSGPSLSLGATAFVAKLDPHGNILYSALIGGTATTQPDSVAVNSKGELVVSGQQISGAPSEAIVALFLLKVSSTGTQIAVGPNNVGGLVTVDVRDNIYVAGVPPIDSTDPPATPGAFQGVPATYYCGCPFLNFACGGDQFVASLTSDLSQVRFLTYVTAQYGAVPASIALDSGGNILIAGTTSAPGYPTTSGSYQPRFTAMAETVVTCGPPIPMRVTSPSGYVTLVKADGAGLIFSTFFSGSKTDRISFAALTGTGIYLGGQAGSVDLPGFNGAVPAPCSPVGFVARMTLDGSAISSSRTPPGTPLAYDSTTATLVLTADGYLLRFDPSVATPIACVLDAADLSPVTAIAPGELLAMFGQFLYFETNPFAVAINPVNGMFPVTSQELGIMANQTASPLLYVSQQQINFQAPYEIAAGPPANLALTYSDADGNSISDSRTLNVVSINPLAFISPSSVVNQSFPLAVNADGTVNSETNPVAAQSIVTVFLDGLGATSPLPVTGLVNTIPSILLSLPLTVMPDCSGGFCYPAPTVVSAGSLPGSISGVTQVRLLTPASPNFGTNRQG